MLHHLSGHVNNEMNSKFCLLFILFFAIINAHINCTGVGIGGCCFNNSCIDCFCADCVLHGGIPFPLEIRCDDWPCNVPQPSCPEVVTTSQPACPTIVDCPTVPECQTIIECPPCDDEAIIGFLFGLLVGLCPLCCVFLFRFRRGRTFLPGRSETSTTFATQQMVVSGDFRDFLEF